MREVRGRRRAEGKFQALALEPPRFFSAVPNRAPDCAFYHASPAVLFNEWWTPWRLDNSTSFLQCRQRLDTTFQGTQNAQDAFSAPRQRSKACCTAVRPARWAASPPPPQTTAPPPSAMCPCLVHATRPAASHHAERHHRCRVAQVERLGAPPPLPEGLLETVHTAGHLAALAATSAAMTEPTGVRDLDDPGGCLVLSVSLRADGWTGWDSAGGLPGGRMGGAHNTCLCRCAKLRTPALVAPPHTHFPAALHLMLLLPCRWTHLRHTDQLRRCTGCSRRGGCPSGCSSGGLQRQHVMRPGGQRRRQRRSARRWQCSGGGGWQRPGSSKSSGSRRRPSSSGGGADGGLQRVPPAWAPRHSWRPNGLLPAQQRGAGGAACTACARPAQGTWRRVEGAGQCVASGRQQERCTLAVPRPSCPSPCLCSALVQPQETHRHRSSLFQSGLPHHCLLFLPATQVLILDWDVHHGNGTQVCGGGGGGGARMQGRAAPSR